MKLLLVISINNYTGEPLKGGGGWFTGSWYQQCVFVLSASNVSYTNYILSSQHINWYHNQHFTSFSRYILNLLYFPFTLFSVHINFSALCLLQCFNWAFTAALLHSRSCFYPKSENRIMVVTGCHACFFRVLNQILFLKLG